MKVVADKLKELSITELDKNTQDMYIRSAFNRYYYASHFIVRGEVGSLVPADDFPHSSQMGKPLKGSYKNKIRDKLKDFGAAIAHEKEKNLDDLIKTIIKNAVKLYDARQLADYKDNAKIVFFADAATISDSQGVFTFTFDDAQRCLNDISDCIEQINIIKQEVGLI